MCARLKTPIGNEAKELGALFHRGATSSGASSSAKRGPTFNPDEQLTGLPDTKKKRGSTSKGRSVNVNICRMKHFTPFIPKGRVRNLLKEQGRIVAVKITRLMSPATVKLCIGRAFRTIKGEWNYLEAGQENRLSIMKNQCLDGNQVCSRRGCLYILDQDVSMSMFIHRTMATCHRMVLGWGDKKYEAKGGANLKREGGGPAPYIMQPQVSKFIGAVP